MGIRRGPNIVRDGLVLALDTANPTSYPGSGVIWKDQTINQNNGTLTNGPTFSEDGGGSIVFDGVNDTTNFGNILNIGLNSWTMSCWVKFTTGSGTFGIMGKTSYRSNIGRYTLYVDGGNIYALFQPSVNAICSTSITPYLDNKFHNLCMTINRTNFLTLYIDGMVKGIPTNISSTSNINLNTSTDFLYIGSYANNTGQLPSFFLNGGIANASIYNRALSSSEILQNYNALKSRFGL